MYFGLWQSSRLQLWDVAALNSALGDGKYTVIVVDI